jgi:hypothetical protein
MVEKEGTGMTIFAEIEDGSNLIRIFRDVWKGRELLQMRKFYKTPESEEWQYGKGCTITFEQLDDVIAGFQKMKDWCEANPRSGD